MIFRKMIEEDFKYISFELKSLIDPNHSDIIMLKNLISKIKILQETIDYKEKSKIDFSTDLNQFVKIQNEFNDKNLNENFNKFLKNKFDNEIILVNSSDLEEVSLPAIKTAVKVPKEYSEKMKNSNILEKYKEHPFNQNIREETLIQEIYLIENSISKTLENFKSNNNIVESDSRTSDSEHKLLKKFLKDTKDEPDITGNLKIYTSKPACISCISGYQYFKNLRKNITIEVITLSKDLIEDLKVI